MGRRVVRNVWIGFLALLSMGPFLMLFMQTIDPQEAQHSLAITRHQRFSQPPSSRPFYEKYWLDSTIVVTIAMGNATQTRLVERLVSSLQTNGGWRLGTMAILTDRPERYERLVDPTSNIFIMRAKPEDVFPRVQKTKDEGAKSTLLEFKREGMRFKRFKTLLLSYMDGFVQQQPPQYQYVIYMDVDVVVARPLTTLLQDFQEEMVQKGVFASVTSSQPRDLESDEFNNATSRKSTNSSSTEALPFMAMFTDCATCARHNTNSGVIILHRERSRPCLQEWNTLFLENADWGVYDQRYLRDIRSNGQCKIHVLPDYHRLYPTWKDMRMLVSRATIVHNTNSYNARKIPAHVQATYFAHLLPDFVDKGRGPEEVELF